VTSDSNWFHNSFLYEYQLMKTPLLRHVHFLLGPEMFWLVITVFIWWLAARNVPPTKEGSEALEKWWWWLAFAAVPLTFLTFSVAQGNRWWFLLRVALAVSIGLCVGVTKLSKAIDYQSGRNSGVGVGWMMSLAFGFIMLFLSSAVAALVIWWTNRKAS
jgi:hypothetical protein